MLLFDLIKKEFIVKCAIPKLNRTKLLLSLQKLFFAHAVQPEATSTQGAWANEDEKFIAIRNTVRIMVVNRIVLKDHYKKM